MTNKNVAKLGINIMDRKFYMIIRLVEDGSLGLNTYGSFTIPANASPRAIYTDIDDAKRVAESLVRKNPDHSFIILESCCLAATEKAPIIFKNI